MQYFMQNFLDELDQFTVESKVTGFCRLFITAEI